MNFSIRHWLASHHIDINQITTFSGAQLAGIAYRIVDDMEVKSLMPFDICTVAEVLEQPLGAVRDDIYTIARLTENLLRHLSLKKALKRNEGTWLAFQIAYLQSLQQILKQEENLQRLWLNRAIIPSSAQVVKEEIKNLTLPNTHLQTLLKTLNPGKLTDTQAEQALSLLGESLLVQQINNATVAWFMANGAEEVEAKLLTGRLTHALPGHLLKVVAHNALPLAQLQKFLRLGITSMNPGAKSTVDDKIDLYREDYRASLLYSLSEPLFMESFALKDIYIPLTGLPKQPKQENVYPVDLKIWAQQQLADATTIAVIESQPGYGKTSFCQMWAAQVAQELYPTWMPIIIRLRNIKYGRTLAETLNSAFPLNADVNLSIWLEQESPRCLLLLDGLDELPVSSQGNRVKALFIQQLLKFQSECPHKIILTTRTTTLEAIPPELLLQLQRITIQPLELHELKQWFQQWTKVQSLPIAQNFFTFLKQAGLFNSQSHSPHLAGFVRQPLMLYLLGVLHRDGLLDPELLQLDLKSQASVASILWEIYHRLSQWLLGYPVTKGIKTMLLRSGSAHIHRTQEAIANLLSGRHPQELLQHMQAIALQILHSNGHPIPYTAESHPQPLAAFYFQTQSTEFSHPQLGEYLCAEAIAAQLQILIQHQEDIYGTRTFILESPSNVAQHVYNLLGYGILTQEVVELTIEALKHQYNGDASLAVILQRLEYFWRVYCQGRWLDQGIGNKALTYFHKLHNPVNLEQVNAAVGLNVFLLLCAGYKTINVAFFPCGNPQNQAEYYPEALLMLLGRITVLPDSTLNQRIISQSLAGINLSGAFLPQVMLAKANFQNTNLTNATLIGANLTGANLTGANLTDADLTGTNLTGVNLHFVNLTNTCLFDAILSDANREIAKLNGALFSLEQYHSLKNLLSQQAFNSISEDTVNTKLWDYQNSEQNVIEKSQTEPIIPQDTYDYDEDETMFGSHPHDE